MHSPMFEELKQSYDNGYITSNSLRKWVKVHDKNPERGITAAEFTEITGEEY